MYSFDDKQHGTTEFIERARMYCNGGKKQAKFSGSKLPGHIGIEPKPHWHKSDNACTKLPSMGCKPFRSYIPMYDDVMRPTIRGKNSWHTYAIKSFDTHVNNCRPESQSFISNDSRDHPFIFPSPFTTIR